MALFFFGCEKETNLEQVETIEESQESPLSITVVGSDKIEQNQGLFQHLQGFSNKTEGVKTSNEHDFVIDTHHVSHIINTDEDYESYTFPIYRDEFNPNKLENLLVSVFPNGTYNTILVTYGKVEGENTFSEVIGIEQVQNSEGLFSKLTQTCVNVAHECCWKGNHSDGRNPDGSKCLAHSVCYSRFCTSGGGGSPTVIPTYSNTGNTSGETGEEGVQVLDPLEIQQHKLFRQYKKL
ncbi:hypothetical protein DIS18_06170 [Algibacter marinivivus]|uniref:Uncharacterized protein n=1 Tax=Algibacter marinivivus TaxID=2100723 RepID=A0A2U2X8L6_9FLAO|nr:hypothetical protein [Algibacter marinivivus]PWH84126.1 hypothetical protein DIS18_06170 [Algibacter marinivivus]